jgi:hypothetical protein
MAVAIGIGAAELAWLAAGAIAALFLASPAGQQAVSNTAKEVSKALSRTEETVDVAPPITECDRPCPPCPSCPPPPPPRIDTTHTHWPCMGNHTHVFYYEPGQNPKTCQCFCRLKDNVICH